MYFDRKYEASHELPDYEDVVQAEEDGGIISGEYYPSASDIDIGDESLDFHQYPSYQTDR